MDDRDSRNNARFSQMIFTVIETLRRILTLVVRPILRTVYECRLLLTAAQRHGVMSQMITPYIIRSEVRGVLSIARTQDGRFHVYRDGNDSVLITGVDFILVRKPLKELLEPLLGDQLLVRPADVLNIATGQLYPGYFEVIVHNIDRNLVPRLKGEGAVTNWYQCLVVSADVKREIENTRIEGLSFSDDFCLLRAAT
jgi:hypothetical protein